MPETLREVLDRIMLNVFPALFKLDFDDLQAHHQHTVCVIPEGENSFKTFNCFAYALGISPNPRYQLLSQRHSDGALTKSEFVSALLADGELSEIDPATAKSGDIALYFADGALKHAGVMLADRDRVRSKWGPCELFEHGLWEVPKSYGEQVKFIAAPDPEHMLHLLDAYVRRNLAG